MGHVATHTGAHTEQEALAAFQAKARQLTPPSMPYAGDVLASDAYEFMKENAAVLVDVRTAPEWQAGVPDVSGTKATFATISWKTAPDFALNPEFLQSFAGYDKNQPIFLMCHAGGRSLDAALALTGQGFRYCFNVTGGFGADPVNAPQYGPVAGWKASGLPWRQS